MSFNKSLGAFLQKQKYGTVIDFYIADYKKRIRLFVYFKLNMGLYRLGEKNMSVFQQAIKI